MKKRVAACLVMASVGLAACASTSSTTTTSTAATGATTSPPSTSTTTPSHLLKLEPVTRLLGLLTAVSCGGPKDCVAVGYLGSRPLMLLWKNSTWPEVSLTGLFATKEYNELLGVSCPDVDNCLAVGTTLTGQSLAIRLSGDHMFPLPTLRNRTLGGVSCVSDVVCYAIGFGNGPVIERWSGSDWSGMKPQLPARGAVVGGVSCSGALCMAVGTYLSNSGAQVAFADRLVGGRWVLTRSGALPSGAESSGADGFLQSVACTRHIFCLAVGGFTPSGESTTYPLVEQWSENRWTTVSLPGVTSKYGTSSSVSCTSASACFTVVGQLILGFGSHGWSVLPSPDTTSLTGVSCWSANGCLAVGTTAAGFKMGADEWNGTTWSALRL